MWETLVNYFTIIDEYGVKYTFSGSDRPYLGPYTNFHSSYVAWHLTRIDLPYSTEPITFSYDYIIESLSGIINNETAIQIRIYNYSEDENNRASKYPDVSPHYYRMKLLSSIQYGNSKVYFIYTNPNANSTYPYNYVEKIKVYENNNLIRNIELFKSIKSILGYHNTPTIPLAKLDRVEISGTNNSSQPLIYECYYSFGELSILDDFTGTDHWGNLNRLGNLDELAYLNFFVMFDPDYYKFLLYNTGVSEITKTVYDKNPYHKLRLSTLHNDHRKPDPPIDHGVLERLKYPTGGYTEFEFENHEFLTHTDLNGNYIHDPEDRIKTSAGGFRIKTITNYTDEGIKAEVKNFRYGDKYEDGSNPSIYTGLGEAVVDPNILSYIKYNSGKCINFPSRYMILGLDQNGNKSDNGFTNPFYTHPYGVTHGVCRDWIWSINFSVLNFRKLLNGRPPVIYPKVTVYYGDIGDDNNYSPENTNGKTVYLYDISDPFSDNDFFESPKYFVNTLSYEPQTFLYNRLIEQRNYEFDGGDFNLVKEVVNDWLYRRTPSIDYIYNDKHPIDVYPKIERSWYLSEMHSHRINYIGIANVLRRKETIIYNQSGDTIYNWEAYNRNSKNQLSSIITQTSDNKSKKIEYKYPTDFNSTSNTMLKSMVNKNMINFVLENRNYLNNRLYSAKYNQYNIFSFENNEIISLKNIYKTELTEPLQSEFIGLNNDGNLRDNSHYKFQASFDYDFNGNLIMQKKANDHQTSYYWGYNKTYPVVKAINVNQEELDQAVTGIYHSISFDLITEPSKSETEQGKLKSFYNHLKDNLPSDSRFYIYTYKPLIGKTSQTGSNGKTIYYEYDSLGRLSRIKDHNLNIIETYEYHYAE